MSSIFFLTISIISSYTPFLIIITFISNLLSRSTTFFSNDIITPSLSNRRDLYITFLIQSLSLSKRVIVRSCKITVFSYYSLKTLLLINAMSSPRLLSLLDILNTIPTCLAVLLNEPCLTPLLTSTSIILNTFARSPLLLFYTISVSLFLLLIEPTTWFSDDRSRAYLFGGYSRLTTLLTFLFLFYLCDPPLSWLSLVTKLLKTSRFINMFSTWYYSKFVK